VHQNPTSRSEWFTTAYFHRLEEIEPERHRGSEGFLATFLGVSVPRARHRSETRARVR
jgi:hypothetical protein